MLKVIKIKNLDCAACAAELSEELNRLEGIERANADFIGQRVTLDYADEEALKRAISCITGFEEVELDEGGSAFKRERHWKEIVSIALSAAFFLPALVLSLLYPSPSDFRYWIWAGLYLASFLAAGWSVAVNAARNLSRVFRDGFHPLALLDENFLMLIAAVGAFAIREFMEGAAVMLLYQIGELLQSVAVGSSRGEIKRLVELKSASAILLGGEEQREVPAEELCEGDVILLRKGDRVPADCVLLEGETALDAKALTGESDYREVAAGEGMLAGCVNEGNAVKARVVRPASESAVSRILDLVENSASQKAKPEKFITRFARIYTPVVVLLAVLIAALPPIFGGNFAEWLVPAIEFLVISCPCALVISVPLTYFSGVGTLARHGVLMKGAVYLDELASVKCVAFDKTGTLTEGKFSVVGASNERALSLAAAVERNSSHPLAQAFGEVPSAETAEGVEELSGMGLAALVGGKRVLVGSERLMRREGIAFAPVESDCVVVYVAEEGKLVGSVELSDRVRPEAKDALEGLKRCGVEHLAVLTGDTEVRAKSVLAGLAIDELHAGLLPEEKPERARRLKGEGKLLYVGDGINDTPVMAESDVSAAMGGLGSDAAIEASDLVLAGDDLGALPLALRGAKKTRRIVRENVVFSIAVKAGLLLASVIATATGLFALPIWAAVFGDVGVMLLAVLNSMRMRTELR